MPICFDVLLCVPRNELCFARSSVLVPSVNMADSNIFVSFFAYKMIY